jgi:hypothetical protein
MSQCQKKCAFHDPHICIDSLSFQNTNTLLDFNAFTRPSRTPRFSSVMLSFNVVISKLFIKSCWL